MSSTTSLLLLRRAQYQLNTHLFTCDKKFKLINAIHSRTMASFLVDEPKYAFLKDLGIEKSNKGVYNGKWGGSGEVCSV